MTGRHTIKLKHLVGVIRAPFLILTPACVLLGLGVAVWTYGRVNTSHFLLALLGALAGHIAVNTLNEYCDFKSGLDARTRRTPFSGGSGTLPANPAAARYTLATGVVSCGVIVLIGFYFAAVRGWLILPLGALGLLIIVAYTPLLTRHPLSCLVAPGLGFGPLMVMGTSFVLTGRYTWTAFFASLIPFFLVANLLLLNQFPDVEADRSVGRKHFPIVIGRRLSSVLYAVFLSLTYLTLVLAVLCRLLPAPSLFALATLPIAVPAGIGALHYADNLPKLVPYMTLNVIINIATPVLAAIGLFVAR